MKIDLSPDDVLLLCADLGAQAKRLHEIADDIANSDPRLADPLREAISSRFDLQERLLAARRTARMDAEASDARKAARLP